jgi:hypothetical protein
VARKLTTVGEALTIAGRAIRVFEFGGVTKFIPSGIINWRPGKLKKKLMIKSHERSIKSFTATQGFHG